MKNLIKITLSILFIASLISCKEKITFTKEVEDKENIYTELRFPVYENYPLATKAAEELIRKDYENYCKYNLKSDVANEYKLSYRTEPSDLSNRDYINVYIKKFIFAGPAIEDEYILSLVYNKKTEKIESLESLTGLSREEIAEIARNKLIEKISSEKEFKNLSETNKNIVLDWVKSGTGTADIYWTAYSASKNEVTIYFSKGQVRSNWYDTQSITLKKGADY